MEKSADAYRTISEVAEDLKLPQHVLRFWETRFPQVKPMKRGGNRRFYRPADVELLRAIKTLLYGDGFTIKGVQRILKEQGPRAVANLAQSGQLGASGKARASGDDRPDESGPVPEQGPGPRPGDAPAARRKAGINQAATPQPALAPPATAGTIGEGLRAVLLELSECERILAAARA